MRCVAFALGFILVAWSAVPTVAQHQASKPDPTEQKDQQKDKIANLILGLGSEAFETREQATSELLKIGEPAYKQLGHAAATHDDAEVRERAKGLVKKIGDGLSVGAELHAVAVVGLHKVEKKEVAVHVRLADRPVILALTSGDHTKWRVTAEDKATIVKVILGGGSGKQEVVGDYAPFVISATGEPGPPPPAIRQAFFAMERDSPAFDEMEALLKKLTGKRISTFQTQVYYDGRPFLIERKPNLGKIPEDTEIHVVGVHRSGTWLLQSEEEILKPASLFSTVIRDREGEATPARRLWELMDTPTRSLFDDMAVVKRLTDSQTGAGQIKMTEFRLGLNKVLERQDLYKEEYFKSVVLAGEAAEMQKRHGELTPLECIRFNRRLLESSFPDHFQKLEVGDVIPGTVTVNVTLTGKPVILVVQSTYSTRWTVNVRQGVQLIGVIAGGPKRQEVTGVDVPVLYKTEEGADRIDFSERAYLYALSPEWKQYADMEARLKKMTGKTITGFQGGSRTDGKPFFVGPAD